MAQNILFSCRSALFLSLCLSRNASAAVAASFIYPVNGSASRWIVCRFIIQLRHTATPSPFLPRSLFGFVAILFHSQGGEFGNTKKSVSVGFLFLKRRAAVSDVELRG